MFPLLTYLPTNYSVIKKIYILGTRIFQYAYVPAYTFLSPQSFLSAITEPYRKYILKKLQKWLVSTPREGEMHKQFKIGNSSRIFHSS